MLSQRCPNGQVPEWSSCSMRAMPELSSTSQGTLDLHNPPTMLWAKLAKRIRGASFLWFTPEKQRGDCKLLKPWEAGAATMHMARTSSSPALGFHFRGAVYVLVWCRLSNTVRSFSFRAIIQAISSVFCQLESAHRCTWETTLKISQTLNEEHATPLRKEACILGCKSHAFLLTRHRR